MIIVAASALFGLAFVGGLSASKQIRPSEMAAVQGYYDVYCKVRDSKDSRCDSLLLFTDYLYLGARWVYVSTYNAFNEPDEPVLLQQYFRPTAPG